MARNRRRTRARRGSRRGGMKKLFIYGLAIVLMGGMGTLFWWSNRTATASAVDRETLCPTATGPVGMTAILIDLTDPLTLTQHTQLLSWLESEVDKAPRGTQFTMGVVSDDEAKWGATAPLCKPQDAASASSFTQNASLIDQRYREQFLDPLQARIRELTSASGADSSPIMESLQALAADTPGFVTFDGPRRVILVSDLLQHSEALSMYRGDNWDSFRNSANFERVGMTFLHADVVIYQVPRANEDSVDFGEIEHFWAMYFERQGAHLPELKRLGDL